MKIGILTMQRIVNNGSLLQAYGLKKVIESFGHTVEFVDYKISDGDFERFTSKEKLQISIPFGNTEKSFPNSHSPASFEHANALVFVLLSNGLSILFINL